MNKVQTFLYVFKNSIVFPKYYNDVVKAKLGFSIKYFLLLSAIASVIFATVSSAIIVPRVTNALNVFMEESKVLYPEDLVITFEDGNWDINQEQPYFIPMPRVDDMEDMEEFNLENLIVFDKGGTINDLERYSTLILLNEKNVIYREDQQGGITSQPIGLVTDFTLDKATVDSGMGTFYKYLRLTPYFIPGAIFVIDLAVNYIIVGISHILLAGFIIYLLSLTRKNKLSYKSACQIVIHTLTVPIIIQLGLRFTDFSDFVAGWFFMLNLVIAIVFMFRMDEDPDLKKIEK